MENKLPKNKTNREVLGEEYFCKAAPAVYEAIVNAYREGYHTGWMRAAKFYMDKAEKKKNVAVPTFEKAEETAKFDR